MLFWDAVVLIVLIVAVVLVVRMRTPRLGTDSNAGELAQARAEVAELRERIQVLERVITDNRGSRELDREIERLRDR